MEQEIWKTIEEYPKYQVSNLGHIKGPQGKITPGSLMSTGYYQYTVYRKSERYQIRVHVEVAKCFISNPENLDEINHKDGDKKNNHIDNLEWCTSGYNSQHAYNTKLQKAGTAIHTSKLSEEDVQYIRQNYIKGDKLFGNTGLGKKFNVWPTTISKIVRNLNWNHI